MPGNAIGWANHFQPAAAISWGAAEIAARLRSLFDLRPAAIVRRFGLKAPIYAPTAAYGHFGREPYVQNGLQFFGWEKLDAVDTLRTEFAL